jgi:hypothetical protein
MNWQGVPTDLDLTLPNRACHHLVRGEIPFRLGPLIHQSRIRPMIRMISSKDFVVFVVRAGSFGARQVWMDKSDSGVTDDSLRVPV